MDGYGDPLVDDEFYELSCPEGWVINNTDCNDADPLAYPGAPELPDDGVDQDCDGVDLLLSNATGVFVAKTGNDANPGTMSQPKLTISAAVTVAKVGRKGVFVAEGNYTESVSATVSLFGGYESVSWSRTTSAHTTRITGTSQFYGSAVFVVSTDKVAIQGFSLIGVSVSGGESSHGAYISGGTASLVDNIIDGGMWSENSYGVLISYGSTTLVNNIINGGSWSSNSYGVYIIGGMATLASNDINGGLGSAYSYGVFNVFYCYDPVCYGAAMLANNFIDGGSGSSYSYGVVNGGVVGGVTTGGLVTLLNNVIHGGSGAISLGVYNTRLATATLANNVIDGGSGTTQSYGMTNSGTATLANNDIDGGTGNDITYGVYNSGNVTTTLVNNFISGGSGSSYSYGLYNPIFCVDQVCYGSVTLVNNDIWGADQDCMIADFYDVCTNQVTLVNACGWTGCDTASGNISDDPLFVNSDSGDFHLQSVSPCRDTGIDPVPDYINAGLADFDFDGDARPYGAGWDIGVDEWTP